MMAEEGARGNDVLIVDRVWKVFRDRAGALRPPRVVEAVRDVSLSVRRGEALGIVGESGSGKTTLARLMTGLLEPTAGRVEYDGRDLASLSGSEMQRLRRDLQIVFQDPVSALDPRQTAFDVLREVLKVHGLLDREGGQGQIERLLEQVDLRREDGARYPHQLSGGQCQRLGVARALALSPSVLVADEPVSQLDVSTRAQIMALLGDLREALGLTLVLIAHDMAVVRVLVDRIAVMYGGLVVEWGTTEDLFARPLHPFTRMLLASVPGSRAGGETRQGGSVPNAKGQTGRGCPFAHRCVDAGTECMRHLPPLRAVEGVDRRVRCLFA